MTADGDILSTYEAAKILMNLSRDSRQQVALEKSSAAATRAILESAPSQTTVGQTITPPFSETSPPVLPAKSRRKGTVNPTERANILWTDEEVTRLFDLRFRQENDYRTIEGLMCRSRISLRLKICKELKAGHTHGIEYLQTRSAHDAMARFTERHPERNIERNDQDVDAPVDVTDDTDSVNSIDAMEVDEVVHTRTCASHVFNAVEAHRVMRISTVLN